MTFYSILKISHRRRYRLETPLLSKTFGKDFKVIIWRKLSEMANATQNSVKPFEGNSDRYNGVTVVSDAESCSLEAFPSILQESLRQWSLAGKRGIWFKVGLSHVDWVPILAKNGFKFHNAKENLVTMYRWLPKDEENNIPPYAHTMVGVGAVVINNKNEILVVSEKYYNISHWKLPGGYVEPGENLIDAAIREVREETNILTEFDTLLTLRHAHGGSYNCSDIYIVISLKPVSDTILMCSRELSDCCWMNVDEYLNHPNVHELNRFFVLKYIEYKENGFKIDCTSGVHQILKKHYTVYHATKNDV